MDLLLVHDNDSQTGDLVFAEGTLGLDESLQSAIYISLFSDRRARPDDRLPGDDGHRRGWWADQLHDDPSDRIGSRLWLLRREKRTEETRRRAEDYAKEALAWLITDGWATSVSVGASWIEPAGTLALDITVVRPGREGLLLHYEVEGDAHAA